MACRLYIYSVRGSEVLPHSAFDIMPPRCYSGQPLPEPTVEELIAREHARVAAWRASLPGTSCTAPVPRAAGGIPKAKTHPMATRPPQSSLTLPVRFSAPVRSTTQHPMSSFGCFASHSVWASPQPSTSHDAIASQLSLSVKASSSASSSNSQASSSALVALPSSCTSLQASSSSLSVAAPSSGKGKNSRKRPTPPIHYTARGDKRLGLQVARDADLLDDALALYKRDIKSSGDTSGTT